MFWVLCTPQGLLFSIFSSKSKEPSKHVLNYSFRKNQVQATVVTSSEQLITLDDWHVVVVIAMRLGFSAIADAST